MKLTNEIVKYCISGGLCESCEFYKTGLYPNKCKEEVIKTCKNLLDDYEIKLKCDLIDRLKELHKEIEELDSRISDCNFSTSWCIDRENVLNLVQDKIDSLVNEIK